MRLVPGKRLYLIVMVKDSNESSYTLSKVKIDKCLHTILCVLFYCNI
jgi:hypothetical protein